MRCSPRPAHRSAPRTWREPGADAPGRSTDSRVWWWRSCRRYQQASPGRWRCDSAQPIRTDQAHSCDTWANTASPIRSPFLTPSLLPSSKWMPPNIRESPDSTQASLQVSQDRVTGIFFSFSISEVVVTEAPNCSCPVISSINLPAADENVLWPEVNSAKGGE